MEAKRRTLKRKPLSECTNTVTIRNSTKSLLKPSKFLLPTLKNPDNKNFCTSPNSKSDTSVVGSNNDTNTNSNGLKPGSIPSLPSTPLRLLNPPFTTAGLDEPMTVYTSSQAAEKKRKEKGKMVVDPFSCPPEERIRNFRDEPRNVGDVGLSKSCTVPRKKHKQPQLPPKKDEHALSQDYIEQQRAYFAEIDAFELPEEAVSESELE